jgi:hypothetical protein
MSCREIGPQDPQHGPAQSEGSSPAATQMPTRRGQKKPLLATALATGSGQTE